STASETILRVYFKFIRSPTPYSPPVQPVFTRYTDTSCLSINSPSLSAYTDACNGKNGAPKQVENTGSGVVTPRSVPASFDVNPLRKWYIACSFVNFEIGGNTPNASAVKKTIVFGCPATDGMTILSIL